MGKLKVFIPILIAGCGVLAISQEKPQADPATSETRMSGKELFDVFCASCHGPAGHGDGPVAEALRGPVPDLTMLSTKNGGKYPLTKVERAIDGDEILRSHGTRAMPVYGDLFREIRRDEAFVKQRVALITGYIESIQQK